MEISINHVSKAFTSYPAVNQVNFNIPSGEFVGLLGPSGSGKTTLLRLIAGLESLDSGKILFNGQDYSYKTAKERKVGFVFQHYALFKHMNIFENVAFGLKVLPRKSRPSKKEISERVYHLLKLVQLEQVANRYPSQLSGGQRQRIALARALAVEPDVLLLDEPFGALDAKVRLEMRQWLRDIHQKLGITTIFVTHDQEEALEMADTVVIMNHGKVEQIGTPEEVYQHPANAFVYRFLGRVNEIKGEQVGFIRPHEISLKKFKQNNGIPSEVSHLHPIGSTVRIVLKSLETNDIFEVDISAERYQELGPLQKGDTLYAEFNNVVVFEEKPDLAGEKMGSNKLKIAY